MTDDSASVRRFLPRGASASAITAAKVLDAMDDVVASLGDAYLQVPEYAALGRERLAGEVLVVSREIVEGFLLAVVQGEESDASRLGVLREMGQRRLEMGVPLEPMLHVYRIAGGVVWRAIAAAVPPGDEAVLGDLGAAWIQYIDEAASIAAAAYLAASTDRIREVDARRQVLLEALLAAESPADVAAVSIRFSVVLVPTYTPLVMEGTEVSAGVDRILAAGPDGIIGGSRRGRLLVLVPGELGDVGPIWRAAGRPHLAFGRPVPPGPELLGEVGRTEHLLATALTADARAGVYGPDDLLMERLVTSDAEAASALRRGVLDALARGDHDGLLISTLRVYCETGSVPETAEREFVHANTVLYRLRRVRDLTGFDPRVPEQAAPLVLALRLERRSP